MPGFKRQGGLMRRPGKHRLVHRGDPPGGHPGVEGETEGASVLDPDTETTSDVCSLLFAMVI